MTVTPTSSDGPVAAVERIASIDVLRGFAVLAILVMNIQSFSMIGAAYMNPHSFGDLTGANHLVWFLSHLLADMKFMAIFSMLFGASIVLMAERREIAGKHAGPLHYRRMLWLMLFGAAHAWFLWYGDILFTYAVCGLWVYPLRKMSPKSLITVGIIVVAVSSAITQLWQISIPWWPPEQVEQLNDEWWAPTPDLVAEEIAAYRGSWIEQQNHRGPSALFMETFVLVTGLFWRCSGLMLIGMALYKLGYLASRRSDTEYFRFIAAGILVGLPLVSLGVFSREASGWDVRTAFFGGGQFNYWGSLPVALAWIATVMLVWKHRVFRRVSSALADVGRMALSCYLLETIICTTIFYGHGFGLFGRIERTGQIAITVAVWALLLAGCRWWLSRFRYGPFEWFWRSLTYWKLQPIQR